MKKQITILLMAICTVVIADPNNYTYTFDNQNYQDRVVPGYYFNIYKEPCDRTFVPMYQHPRFGLYSKCRSYSQDCNCRDILLNNDTDKHGMVRCYNHEGLSIEYYYR